MLARFIGPPQSQMGSRNGLRSGWGGAAADGMERPFAARALESSPDKLMLSQILGSGDQRWSRREVPKTVARVVPE
jgi:hypothetical protein